MRLSLLRMVSHNILTWNCFSKKKPLATHIQKKFSNEQYYGSLDTRKNQYKKSNSLSRDTVQAELSALDIKMRQYFVN